MCAEKQSVLSISMNCVLTHLLTQYTQMHMYGHGELLNEIVFLPQETFGKNCIHSHEIAELSREI
jgi:hypothetical protein